MAESNEKVTIKKKRTIGAGQTLAVDSLPMARFNCLEYFLCYKQSGGPASKTLKVLVLKADNALEDSVHSRIGNALGVETNLVVNGLNAELQVVNNEAFAVELVFTRTKT